MRGLIAKKYILTCCLSTLIKPSEYIGTQKKKKKKKKKKNFIIGGQNTCFFNIELLYELSKTGRIFKLIFFICNIFLKKNQVRRCGDKKKNPSSANEIKNSKMVSLSILTLENRLRIAEKEVENQHQLISKFKSELADEKRLRARLQSKAMVVEEVLLKSKEAKERLQESQEATTKLQQDRSLVSATIQSVKESANSWVYAIIQITRAVVNLIDQFILDTAGNKNHRQVKQTCINTMRDLLISTTQHVEYCNRTSGEAVTPTCSQWVEEVLCNAHQAVAAITLASSRESTNDAARKIIRNKSQSSPSLLIKSKYQQQQSTGNPNKVLRRLRSAGCIVDASNQRNIFTPQPVYESIDSETQLSTPNVLCLSSTLEVPDLHMEETVDDPKSCGLELVVSNVGSKTFDDKCVGGGPQETEEVISDKLTSTIDVPVKEDKPTITSDIIDYEQGSQVSYKTTSGWKPNGTILNKSGPTTYSLLSNDGTISSNWSAENLRITQTVPVIVSRVISTFCNALDQWHGDNHSNAILPAISAGFFDKRNITQADRSCLRLWSSELTLLIRTWESAMRYRRRAISEAVPPLISHSQDVIKQISKLLVGINCENQTIATTRPPETLNTLLIESSTLRKDNIITNYDITTTFDQVLILLWGRNTAFEQKILRICIQTAGRFTRKSSRLLWNACVLAIRRVNILKLYPHSLDMHSKSCGIRLRKLRKKLLRDRENMWKEITKQLMSTPSLIKRSKICVNELPSTCVSSSMLKRAVNRIRKSYVPRQNSTPFALQDRPHVMSLRDSKMISMFSLSTLSTEEGQSPDLTVGVKKVKNQSADRRRKTTTVGIGKRAPLAHLLP